MQLISLFSGIGGFELAAEWMGWQNIVSCEINPFGRKVLEHYWPDAYHHDDIHTLTYEKIKHKIDPSTPVILTGGFPCQPYSSAGKRLGKEDERHLWPEMLRIIREVKPTWIVGENVLGLVNWNGGLVFHEVQTDLEAEGYEVQPYVLPACAVNAPHRRDRVWFVAYSASKRLEGSARESVQGGIIRFAKCNRVSCDEWSAADTTSNRRQWTRERFETEKGLQQGSKTTGELEGRSEGLCNKWDAANTSNKGLQRSKDVRSITECRKESYEQSSRCFRSTWSQFPTQSPIRSRNDGISSELDGITFSKWRNESIKAAGNAIVPQVVYQIFKAIQSYNESIH